MITLKQLLGIALGLVVAATAADPTFAQQTGVNSAARAKALRECSIAAAKYPELTWGIWEVQTYRACMSRRGQRE